MARKQTATLLEFPIRASRADLGHQPQVGYVRKSSESEDKQVRSTAQQRAQIEAHAGPMTQDLWFSDDASGRSFDRPSFQRLLSFCKTNPQPKSAPGKVWFFDVSRFGRIVDAETGKPDVDATEYQRLHLKALGWLVCFVSGPNTGTPLIDGVLRVVQMEASSQYTTDLSAKVSAGKADAARGDSELGGWWTGGVAPYGTQRYDISSKRALNEAFRDEEGLKVRGDHAHQRSTVLVRNDEEAVPLEWAMRQYLKGSSLDAVCAGLTKRVPTRAGNPWMKKSLINAFTNKALVGEMVHKLKAGPVTYKKRWDPLVDPDLFWKVQDELARRRSSRGAFTRRGEYVLTEVYCAKCGSPIWGGTEQYNGASYRYYRHQSGRGQLGPEQLAKAKAAGCGGSRVPADAVELAVRDLLRRQRGTAEYAKHLRLLFEASANAQGDARRQVSEAEAAVTKLRLKVQRVLVRAEEEEDSEIANELFGRWKALKEELRMAEREAEKARVGARAEQGRWEDVESRFEESEDLLAAWDSLDPDARRAIVDWWVVAIFMTVPTSRKLSERKVTLRVYLHSFPQAPELIELGVAGKASWSRSADTKESAFGVESTSSRCVTPNTEGFEVHEVTFSTWRTRQV